MIKPKYKILLVGCGQIGSRHLQAIATIKGVKEVYIVEPAPSSVESGKKRLLEVPNVRPEIKYCWLDSFNNDIPEGDLCIIATQAKERSSLIKEIAETSKYKKFLIEKIVSQSIEQYEDLLEFSDKFNLLIWVNCPSRTYKIHQYIKSLIEPNQIIALNVIGGGRDLACVGIHYVDLFVFLDNAKEIIRSEELIDEVLYPSRRSKDIYELRGTLLGGSAKGSSLAISYKKFDTGPDLLSIVTPNYKFVIDQCNTLTAFESSKKSGWKWKKISIKENYLISEIEKSIVSDILKKEKCKLPNLRECYPAHKYILSALLPYFNKLLKRNNDYCPIT